MDLLAANQVLLLSCILSAVGWVIAFMGLCFSSATAIHLSWWIIAYELGLVTFVCAVVGTDRIEAYRPVVLVFVAISVPYSTDEVARYITKGYPALSASSVGYIILMAVQFFWVFLFGSHHELFRALRSTDQPYSYPTKQAAPTMGFSSADMDGPKAVFGYPMIYNPPPSEESTVFVSPHAEYNIPVVALHLYEANPDDPNELSFDKGEILHVHERKGNWWQARKADGTVGMIPSNYVTPTNQ